MNRHVNAIAGRLSLRPPQRQSLEILDRITEIVPPRKGADLDAALAAIRSEFPTVTDFEREFPSALLRAGDRRRQDTADGRLHQLSASRARAEQLLRPRAEPDHLQQADHRLHAEHAQVRVQGHRRVRGLAAGHHDRRQLRARRSPAAGSCSRRRSTSSTSRRSTPRCAAARAPHHAAFASKSARAISTIWPASTISC